MTERSSDESDNEPDLSEPEVIDLEEEKRNRSATEEQSTEPDLPMSVEEATEIVENIGEMAMQDPGAPFELEVLQAAAILRMDPDTKPIYQRAHADIKASDVNSNDWSGDVKEQVRDLKPKASRDPRDTRPVIEDRAELHEMVDEACEALQAQNHIYQRGGELVEIRVTEDGPAIEPLKKGRIRDVLSSAARFEKYNKDGSIRTIKPPKSLVDAISARGHWGLDELAGFVDGACVLEDGTVLTTEGYHPTARTYLRRAPDGEMTGLKSPTRDDAVEARERLLDLLVDFELDDDDRAAHESAWLAALLTIVAKPAVGQGYIPMILIDANRQGVGKTLLAQLACKIATGRRPSARSAPTGYNRGSEWRKIITSIARGGHPIAFFDNVKGKLGGGSLEAAITSNRWEDRVLGESRDWEGELNCVWLATSNNGSLTPDMRRRTLYCRIRTRSENPENRSNFEHPNLMKHVEANRSQYLQDALTILRAWFAAGEPTHDLTPWGSFEEWGRVIRNAIIHAGGPDPCRTRDGLRDADPEIQNLRAVLEAWPVGERFTSSQLAEAMSKGVIHTQEGTFDEQNSRLPAALNELLPKASASSVGMRLRNYMERPEAGREITRIRGSKKGRRYWVVREANNDS